jgi:CheY-like chemotaxis protein
MLEPEIVTAKKALALPELSKKGQLLVVDDDKDIQTLLSRTLSIMGYAVTLAGNGLEAMSLLLTGSYDWVITGFHMPLMNGWELARIVKKQSPKTRVVVVRGSVAISIGQS